MKGKKKTKEIEENEEEERKESKPQGQKTPGGISVKLLTPCRRVGLARKKHIIQKQANADTDNRSLAAKILQESIINEQVIQPLNTDHDKRVSGKNKLKKNSTKEMQNKNIEASNKLNSKDKIDQNKIVTEKLTDVNENAEVKTARKINSKRNLSEVGDSKKVDEEVINKNISKDNLSEDVPKKVTEDENSAEVKTTKKKIFPEDDSSKPILKVKIVDIKNNIPDVPVVESLSDRIKSKRRNRTKTYEEKGDSDFDEPLSKLKSAKTLPVSRAKDEDSDDGILPYASPKRPAKKRIKASLKSKESQISEKSKSFQILADIHSPMTGNSVNNSPISVKEKIGDLISSEIIMGDSTSNNQEVEVDVAYLSEKKLSHSSQTSSSSQENITGKQSSFRNKLKLKKSTNSIEPTIVAEIEEIKRRIIEKEKIFQELKKEKKNCLELDEQIIAWTKCSHQALQELLKVGKEKSQFDKNFEMVDLLRMMCIPNTLVRFDSSELEFKN